MVKKFFQRLFDRFSRNSNDEIDLLQSEVSQSGVDLSDARSNLEGEIVEARVDLNSKILMEIASLRTELQNKISFHVGDLERKQNQSVDKQGILVKTVTDVLTDTGLTLLEQRRKLEGILRRAS